MRDKQFLMIGVVQLIVFASVVMVVSKNEMILENIEQLSSASAKVTATLIRQNDLLNTLLKQNQQLESKLQQMAKELENREQIHHIPPVHTSRISQNPPSNQQPVDSSVFGFCNRSLDSPNKDDKPVFTVLDVSRHVENPTNSTCYEMNQIRSNFHLCMYPPEDDLISLSIERDGIWEASKSHLLAILYKEEKQRPNPRRVVLDVGANQGYYGFNAAAFGYKVVMVEPGPTTADLLRQTIIKNGFEGLVTVLRNAVSNVRETLRFSFMNKNSGSSSIQSVSNPSSTDVLVHSVLVDDIVEFLHINPSDIFAIKTDVEGFDYHAYDGMKRILTEGKPPVLTMEVGKVNTCDVNKVLDKMYELGYLLVEEHRPSFPKTLEEAKELVENGLNEAVFIRQDLHGEIAAHITMDPRWYGL